MVDEYITMKEAARITGFSETIIRKAYDDGKIAGRRTPGGHRRILQADLVKITGT